MQCDGQGGVGDSKGEDGAALISVGKFATKVEGVGGRDSGEWSCQEEGREIDDW